MPELFLTREKFNELVEYLCPPQYDGVATLTCDGKCRLCWANWAFNIDERDIEMEVWG